MRPVCNSNWSLLGNFRGSLLYGEILDNDLIYGAGPYAIEDEMMQGGERVFCI